MEYADVTIHKNEETSANMIPNESTRNCMGTPGSTHATLYTMGIPFRMVGTMETTIKNFAIAAANVQPSRILGFLLRIRNGMTIMEIRTARKGLIENIESI
jgi:hypothetical protein